MNNAEMKKVLHISNSNRDGAGMVPEMIHREFEKRGHFSRLLVHGEEMTPEDHVISYFDPTEVFAQRARRYIRRRIPNRQPDSRYVFLNEDERNHYLSPDRILKKVGFVPDIIIFYWISEFVNTRTIRDLYKATGAHLVWVMTDMAPYTGGCHYAWACKGYETDCPQCPAWADTRLENSRARRNLSLKQEMIRDLPITIVASHGQSFEMVSRSALFDKKKRYPHYLPVDTRAFEGISLSEARRQLGIPDQKICLFFGATQVTDERKGWPLLKAALTSLAQSMTAAQRDELVLLIAGGLDLSADLDTGLDTIHVGNLDFRSKLPLAFIASDVYLSASQQDTGPYMVNLSVAYRCPVVAFDIGVARALVRNGETGFLAEEISAAGLAEAIRKMVELPAASRERMRETCHTTGQQTLTWGDDVLIKFGLDPSEVMKQHTH